MDTMNMIAHLVYTFLEDIGRIRAASYFAHTGDIEAARKIMLAK